MNKLLLILSVLILFSCKKKETKPTTQTQTTNTSNSTVWCFYQTNYGNKVFLNCCSTVQEYQLYSDYCINNNLQVTVERKSKCNQCK